MKKITICLMFTAAFLCTGMNTQAQLLKKVKDKMNQVGNKVVGNKVDSTANANAGETGTAPGGKPSNKGGAGLTKPPAVPYHLG